MRRFLWIAVLFLLIAPAWADAPLNIGHRGMGTNAPGNPYPENTIPSLQEAFAVGADMVELDVLLTADDEVVVIHDGSLDRTTDCTGAVADLTLVEVQSCDAAFGTPLEGTGVVVPTLGEAFAAMAGDVNVEIKSDTPYSAAHIAERVTDEILLAGAEDRVIFSSFSLAICEAVEALDDTWLTALLTSEVFVNAEIDEAAAAGLDGIHPYYLQTFPAQVNYAHDAGLFINVWTVDTAFLLRQTINKGVDGIVTNQPEVLADLLDDDDDDDDDDDNDDDDNDDDDDDDDNDDDDDDDDDDDTAPTDDDTTADDDDNDDDDDDEGCGC